MSSSTAIHALVLIAPPGALSPDDLAEAGAAAKAAGGGVDWTWLSEGEAAETVVAEDDAVVPAVRASLAGRPIDANRVALANRRKRLLIADMDSTMIAQECIDELADFAGLKARVSAITERAMRGELDFEAALRERVAMLAGLGEGVIAKTWEARITLTPGGRELLTTMRAGGAYAALVSGGFTVFTARVAEALRFDEHRSNTLLTKDGKLTGEVVHPILGREAKLERLRAICAERGLDMALTLAVGDGANDLAMIGEAGLGVAFRAKPAVAEAADASVAHGDLTALLFLQGYRRAEFVS